MALRITSHIDTEETVAVQAEFFQDMADALIVSAFLFVFINPDLRRDIEGFLSDCFEKSLIALFHETDIHHDEAKDIFKTAERKRILISDYLLNELLTVLLRKTDLKSTTSILDFLLNDETLIVRHTTREEFFVIIGIFKEQKGGLSFVDCPVVWMSKKLGLKIATFDKNPKRAIQNDL